MESRSEERRAKSAYEWLRASPLVTVGTLLLIAGFNLPSNLCAELTGLCQYGIFTPLDVIGGVLISALWHLNLLRFVNDPKSEFVRRHGRQALKYAGARTAVALGAALLDYFTAASGVFSCFAIALLIILWGGNTKNGLEEIAKELKQDEPNTDVHPMETVDTGSTNLVSMEENTMTENDSRTPEEILDEIYANLKSDDGVVVLQAIAALHEINFSSEAILRQLERLALHLDNEDIRNDALAALELPAQRHVRGRLNRLARAERNLLMQEISRWEKDHLLKKGTLEVLRRRYDFDFAPPLQTAPIPAPVRAAVPPPSAIAQGEANVPAEGTQPAVPMTRSVPPPAPMPEGPRPSLLQTLTSEASIKIYLYLGAFFVIASAAILGVAIPELRMPILIAATFIFGGLAVAIKKRLPQPSFALFIVFSFLLPITANTIQQTLGLREALGAGYWMMVYFGMSVIWSGGTWLYESRLFSITAFGSLTLAFFQVVNLFEAQAEFLGSMAAVAALIGLAGVWYLKKWKDANFALPLFLSAQLLELILLTASISIFGVRLIGSSAGPIWNLAHVMTWALAFAFYVFSNSLFPFPLFPWLAAAILIPMPWFMAAAFDMQSLGSTITLLIWGAALSIASEISQRVESPRSYSLPVLLASLPTFTLALGTSLSYGMALVMIAAFEITVVFTILHILRTRRWLWILALLNFSIAYFSFLNLEPIYNLQIFIGYQLLVISMIFLLPDLFLKKDFKANWDWRMPLRAYGVFFAALTFVILLMQRELNHVAICYAVYALFFTAYALAYRKSIIGYVPAVYLPLAVIFALNSLQLDAWLPALTALAVLYFLLGLVVRTKEDWSVMLRNSALTLGTIISFVALLLMKESSGWYALVIGLLFVTEMYFSRSGWFEIGAPLLFNAGAFLIMRDLKIMPLTHYLLVFSLIWLVMDMLAHLTFSGSRPLSIVMRGVGGMLALANFLALADSKASIAAIAYATYTVFFAAYTAAYRKPILGYIPAATLPLTIVFALNHFRLDMWVLSLTALAVFYFLIGLAIRSKENWSFMLRNSALALGTFVSFGALVLLEENGGWFALVSGLLFIAEMYLRRDGMFEVGAPTLFTVGAFLILHDLNVDELTYHLLAYSLVWIIADLLAHLTFTNPRPLKLWVRGAGVLLAMLNYGLLFFGNDDSAAAIGFGVYTLLFLIVSLVYRQATLFYAFTLTLPLFATFLFRSFDMPKWIHPVIVIAMIYYAAGYLLRDMKRATGWDLSLLNSGLGLGVVVSLGAPIVGGLDAALPVAAAGTLWAVEAFAKKNAWLAFPANGLYLLSYFIILFELNVNEPQFFSMGAALLGLTQHYLLVRAESKSGAFIMGMLSQFVLLGTTYIEMVNKNELAYFFVLFLQSLAVLGYGMVIRSRSLTFFPIGFVVLGVITVVYSALKGVATIFLIGCTGILLLMLGVFAVLLREKLSKLGDRISDWKA